MVDDNLIVFTYPLSGVFCCDNCRGFKLMAMDLESRPNRDPAECGRGVPTFVRQSHPLGAFKVAG